MDDFDPTKGEHLVLWERNLVTVHIQTPRLGMGRAGVYSRSGCFGGCPIENEARGKFGLLH